MIKVFHQIRRNLLNEHKTKRYLLYAIGEIILVVIGILIALQVNNWNEKKAKEAEFRNVLEQLYNVIITEVLNTKYHIESNEYTIDVIQEMITNIDSISDSDLEDMLLDFEFSGLYTKEYQAYLNKLPLDLENDKQIRILKQVNNYFSGNVFRDNNIDGTFHNIYHLFDKHALARPYPVPGYENFFDYYTEEDMRRIRSILKSPEGISTLKNLRHERIRFNLLVQSLVNDGNTILLIIKNYMPEVRLLYEDVGVLGTATTGGWDQSIPMKEVDGQNNIWEIEIKLSEGAIKFRTRNSWNQNWGGQTFPHGKAEYYGSNIMVKPGLYKITLNLSEETYQFKQLKP